MAKATISKGVKTKTTWANALKRDWQLYLLLMIPVALVVIFNYASSAALFLLPHAVMLTVIASTSIRLTTFFFIIFPPVEIIYINAYALIS